MWLHRLRQRGRGAQDEGGAALVTFVLWLPVLLLIVVFVIDVGNWWEHRRHLQLQADAGALAAAGDFSLCGRGDDATANGTIAGTAAQYSGDEADSYNQQVGGTSPDNVHMEINSATWFDQSDPTDSTVVEEPPCAAKMVDVKMTETDLPLFFQVADLFSSVPFINTHARVQIFQKSTFNNAVPIGVPDPSPTKAWVQYYDQTNGSPGTLLGSAPLAKGGASNGLTSWDSASSPLGLNANTAVRRIGIQVVLSGDPTYTSATPPACSAQFVTCYPDLLFVRVFSPSDAAGISTPQLRSVSLTTADCTNPAGTDPYFSAKSTACTVTINADVDFGANTCNANMATTGIQATITATPGGNMTQSPTTCAGNVSHWTRSITVNPAAGPIPITMKWSRKKQANGTTNCNGPSCTGDFESGRTVQRTFAASTAVNNNTLNGPIRLAQVWEGGSFWTNSLSNAGAHAIYVKLGLTQGFEENAQSVNAALVHLAIVGNQGGHLDCNPAANTNLRQELGNGCPGDYEKYTSGQCVVLPTAPADCVPLQTGNATGQVRQGMNDRVQGGSNQCVNVNHWTDFPDLDQGDPRIVTVFLVPFNSLNGTGNQNLPITGFATFYITGYDQSPCPTTGVNKDDPAGQDEVVGRFFKYVDSLNEGEGGDQTCDFNDLGACVAVLTL